jgi:IMP dehydrogenase/GMP reductase
MEDTITYRDVLIEPQYSEIRSRSEVDISTKLGHTTLKIPVISANMKDITGPTMAAAMYECGGLGILHRFCAIEEQVDMFNKTPIMFKNCYVGVSIGVKEEDKKRFKALHNAGARLFCIDVAHGHHILVKEMIQHIKRYSPVPVMIIAGNIATGRAYKDLAQWGADAVKVGIGPSPVCRTRYNTGVGVSQLSALIQINDYRDNHDCLHIPIIADGGISCVGDIAKALVYADAVMLGSMISGCSETPGHVFRDENNEFYKVYGGSASSVNKTDNKFVEGVIKPVRFKGKVKYIMREIEQGLQSAFSYSNARNIKEFKERCILNRISVGSQYESKI